MRTRERAYIIRDLTNEELESIRNDYLNGMTFAKMRKKYGFSDGTLCRLRDALGWPCRLKPRTAPRANPIRKNIKEQPAPKMLKPLKTINDEGALLLAAAIIQSAIKDYKTALKKNDKTAIAYYEHFFISKWGELLTMGCGKEIIHNVKYGKRKFRL